MRKWFAAYDSDSQTPSNKFLIDNETVKMVRYFVASNTAAKNFDCPYFRDLLVGYSVQRPCSDTYSNSILPSIVQAVKYELEKLLNKCFSVCMISDIWTSKHMLDLVATNIIDIKTFNRETILIGKILQT